MIEWDIGKQVVNCMVRLMPFEEREVEDTTLVSGVVHSVEMVADLGPDIQDWV